MMAADVYRSPASLKCWRIHCFETGGSSPLLATTTQPKLCVSPYVPKWRGWTDITAELPDQRGKIMPFLKWNPNGHKNVAFQKMSVLLWSQIGKEAGTSAKIFLKQGRTNHGLVSHIVPHWTWPAQTPPRPAESLPWL